MTDHLSAAVEIAREAGALLAELSTQPLEINTSAGQTWLRRPTASPKLLSWASCAQRFPDHAIVAEEGGNHQVFLRLLLVCRSPGWNHELCARLPDVLRHAGPCLSQEVIAGVVFDPTHNDMYTAERGAGAYLNDQRLHVSPAEN